MPEPSQGAMMASTSPSKIPLPKSKIPVSSPPAPAEQPSPTRSHSRIPRMVSPERHKIHREQQFSRRLTPPSSVRRGNRMDNAELQEDQVDNGGGILLEAQLAARVRMQQQHRRRGSDPALSMTSKARSTDELSQRKTSAPLNCSSSNVVSPSRIPIAQDYILSNSSGNLAARSSRSSSKSVDGGGGSSRNSPVRQVSPPRKVSIGSSVSGHSVVVKSGIPIKSSSENNGDNRESCDVDQSKIPVHAPRSSSSHSSSSSNGGSNTNSSRPIPSPRMNVPTLGFSFSPERMLPNKRQNRSLDDDNQMGGVEICSEQQDDEGETQRQSNNNKGGSKRRFEAFVMTGDRMIQLAKTPANHEFKSKYTKSVSDSCIVTTSSGQNQQHETRLSGQNQYQQHPGQNQHHEARLAGVQEEEDGTKIALNRSDNDDDFDHIDHDDNSLDVSGVAPLAINNDNNSPTTDTEPTMSENFDAESVLKISPEKTSSSPETPEWSLLGSYHQQQHQQQNGGNDTADVLMSPGNVSNRTLTQTNNPDQDITEEEQESLDVQSPPPPFGQTFTRRSSSPQKSLSPSSVSNNMPNSRNSQISLASNQSSESEESDIDSLHSYHPPVRVVDIPSAVRLAKRLYHLDGFKTTDVSRHLSRNTDYNHVVAEEYLKYFDFTEMSLDEALRRFLGHFCLTGETQEKERVLLHFSRRYLEGNTHLRGGHCYRSPDAVHTLACAILLLNTDLHGQALQPQRRMTCLEFIANLSEMNDGGDYPRDLLKNVYSAIKLEAIPWALGDSDTARSDETNDKEDAVVTTVEQKEVSIGEAAGGINPFLSLPDVSGASDFKSGYVMRKSCYDADGKKTKMGRRSWKMFFATLRDTVLYCFRDEKAARHAAAFSDANAAVRVHHASAAPARDYFKKKFVFRLKTADRAEYLFQASDEKELLTWVEAINLAAALNSAPALPAPCSASRRFQRPLLPSAKTKLSPSEQLEAHKSQLSQLREDLAQTEVALKEATTAAGGPGSGGTLLRRKGPSKLALEAAASCKEKLEFLTSEIERYETYVGLLEAHLGDMA